VEGEFSFGHKGTANNDLATRQGSKNLLFETKLLKFVRPTKSGPELKRGIFKDFVKLVLPVEAGYQRVALVASIGVNKLSDPIENLINDKESVFEFDSVAHTFTRDHKGKKVTCFTGENLKYVQAWCKNFQFDNFTTKLEADKSNDVSRVVIFSIHRSSTVPAA
jgi:hypothetical protein